MKIACDNLLYQNFEKKIVIKVKHHTVLELQEPQAKLLLRARVR